MSHQFSFKQRDCARDIQTLDFQKGKLCVSCSMIYFLSYIDTLAERLRRRPAKPMGSPRVGSNPTGVVLWWQNSDIAETTTCSTFAREHPCFNTKSENRMCTTTTVIAGRTRHHASNWLLGLVAWFSLRVREVPGSIPGAARFPLLLWGAAATSPGISD